MDHLVGLKENVIIGKLIPAGAGLTAYRKLAEELVPDVEAEEEAVENVYAASAGPWRMRLLHRRQSRRQRSPQ